MINNRDSTMAALLFAIVLVFFVCHAPKAVINIYEVKIYLTYCYPFFHFVSFLQQGFLSYANSSALHPISIRVESYSQNRLICP